MYMCVVSFGSIPDQLQSKPFLVTHAWLEKHQCNRSSGAGVTHLEVHDITVSDHDGIFGERRLAVEHFIGYDAQGPPVTLQAVRPLVAVHTHQHFRGDVVGGAHRHLSADLRK